MGLDDVFEGSHAEFAFNESYVSPGEKAWLAWVKKVETILASVLHLDYRGKPTLDGDEKRDGYSLDDAYDFFANGDTPEQYAAEINSRLDNRHVDAVEASWLDA